MPALHNTFIAVEFPLETVAANETRKLFFASQLFHEGGAAEMKNIIYAMRSHKTQNN